MQDNGTHEALELHFHDLMNCVESHATHFVHEALDIDARDEDMDDLPTHMKKLSFHRQFCWLRGWKISPKSKGSVVSEEHADGNWKAADECLPVPSCMAFLAHWKCEHHDFAMRKQ